METRDDTMKSRGVDADDSRRPGVPMEQMRNVSDELQPQQPVEENITIGADRHLTPVFGTAQPPRGLSGLLRRAAYRVHEQKPRHWMMLFFADRVDVVESAIGDFLQHQRFALLFAGLVGGVLMGLRRG